MVETNPRYDPIIEIDPAYTQPNAPGGLRVREALEKKGGPVIQQIKETVPQFENIQAEFQDKSAQDLSKLIKPFYNFMALGVDNYNQQKQLNKEVIENTLVGMPPDVTPGSLESIRLIQKNAPAFMDYLKNEGYDANTNILREFQSALYGGQQEVFNKLASGEAKYSQLSAEERSLTDPLLVGIDLLDAAGLTALATKGFSKPFIKFVTDAKNKNVPTATIVEEASKLFPEETPRATTFFLGEQKGVNFAPLKGDGPGGGSQYNKSEFAKLRAAEKKENAYGYLRSELDNFMQDRDVFTTEGFNKYLQNKNVNVTGGTNILRAKHLKKAFDYLNENNQYRIKKGSGTNPQWMVNTEKILEELPEGEQLFPSQILNELKKQNIELPKNFKARDITYFINRQKSALETKPEDAFFNDANLINKVNLGNERDLTRQNTFDELTGLLNSLKADPSMQGKGQKNYSITNLAGESVPLSKLFNKLTRTDQKGENFMTQFPDFPLDELKQLTYTPPEATRDFIFEYLPTLQKRANTEFSRGVFRLFDNIRVGGIIDDTEEGFTKLMDSYGIYKKTDPLYNKSINEDKIGKLINDLDYINSFGPEQKKQYKKLFIDSIQVSNDNYKKFTDTVMSSEALQKQVLSEAKKVKPEIDNIEDAIKYFLPNFAGHISHVAKLADFKKGKKGLQRIASDPSILRINLGYENMGLQNTAEAAIDRAVGVLSKNLTPTTRIDEVLSRNVKDPTRNALATLLEYDTLMKKKGMAAYRRFDKKQLNEDVIRIINQYFDRRDLSTEVNLFPGSGGEAGTIINVGVDNIDKKFNDILLGAKTPQTVEQIGARFDSLMDYYLQNPKEFKLLFKDPKERKVQMGTYEDTPMKQKYWLNLNNPGINNNTDLKRGGVKMAIGGQNFTENMNQQQFTPDPAIEGESAFDQAVKSGNLTALNIPKIFKGLGEAFGVYTPKKVGKSFTGEMSAVTPVEKSDFPLQSFTLEKIQNSQTNQAKPQDWINELQGGKNVAPTSELLDSGLFQYLADYEKYFPGQRISKATLLKVLEENPISNLKVRIKGAETGDPAYDTYMGRPRHENAGNARIDEAAEDYREVIIEAGTLPTQKSGEEFVNSTHFAEKNVLAFGRVGTYKNSKGENVAVIQEMQTDYLTQVQNERERLEAQIKKLTNDKTKAEERLAANPESYDVERNQNIIKEADSKLPALLKLQESNLIKPYPNIAAQELIPGYNKQLQDLQKQINDLSMQGVRRENPEFLMQINRLEGEQKQVLEALLDLNRASGYDILAKDVQVPDISQRDDLINYSEGLNNYVSMKPIKTFAPTPLNKQTDYVDAIIKAVIKDAENRDINKITIMPADIGPNTRWSKNSDDAKKKFRNLYDKVGIQTLRNIAKKYGGEVNVEQIIDSTKGSLGLRFLNKGVDGEFQVLKETDIDPSVTIRREDLGPSKPPEGLNAFLNEEILNIAKDYGPNEVVFRKEIAPGQTMEYFVNVKQGDVIDQKFDLVPLGDADRAENATIIIEEYNPSAVDMFVLTLPETNKQAPMYLFKKKKGGIMPDDRLVSITDIYGDY